MGNIQNDLSQLSDEEFNRISEQFDAQPKPYLDQVKEGMSGLISGDQSTPDVPWFLKHAQPAISGAKNLGLGMKESASNQLRGLEHVMGQEAPTQSPLDKMIGSRLQAMGVPAPRAREQQQPFVSVQTGSGPAYESGKFIAEAIPNLLSKNPISGIAGSSIQAMALDPNNYQDAAKSGAGWGVFGEALPVAVKGLGKAVTGVADKFTRNEYSQKIMKNLAEHYKESKDSAMSHLKPLLKKYGKEDLPLEGASKIVDAVSSNKGIIGKKGVDMYNKFNANPTLENAQKLQSILGDRVRTVNTLKKDVTDVDIIDELSGMRESILGAMDELFKSKGGNADKKYNMFREKYAKDVGPYLNDKKLNQIAHGETKGMTPEDLDMIVGKSVQGDRSKVYAGHKLREVAPEIEKKLSGTALYTKVPGSKGAAEILQNDRLAGFLKGIGNLYPWARSGALGQLNAQQIKPFDFENNRGGE